MPVAANVEVRRHFAATPERVFDAWTDATNIGAWMFAATMGDEVLRTSIDPREGGRFSFVVRRNGQELDHNGTYIEFDRPRRLAFTWGIGEHGDDGSIVTIAFAPSTDGGCDLTLVHELAPEWAEYAERTRAGWERITGALASTLT